MNLESPKVSVAKAAETIFESLCNVANFEKLMPDSIAKFEVVATDAFIFGLKGMPEIKLKITEKTAPSKIILGSASDKIPFTLTAIISNKETHQSEIQLFFEGEFNAMMGMMIKAPIGKFIETLAANMHKL